MDWFDISDWLLYGSGLEELAVENEQREFDEGFDDNEYDVDENEYYS